MFWRKKDQTDWMMKYTQEKVKNDGLMSNIRLFLDDRLLELEDMKKSAENIEAEIKYLKTRLDNHEINLKKLDMS